MEKHFCFPVLPSFDFMIAYNETSRQTHTKEIDLHTHNCVEFYINLSGDVSFLVQDKLFPVSRGDIIVSRPGEYHHCVYRSDAPHALYWILIDLPEDYPKDAVSFSGANLIAPLPEVKEEILAVCDALYNGTLTDFERYSHFFRMVSLMQEASGNRTDRNRLPEDLTRAIRYIDAHIEENISLSDIAESLFMSKSTLERRFRRYVDMLPSAYIRNKKLLIAKDRLFSGMSVLEAGVSVGYQDNSHFIRLFTRQFGMTPYRYVQNKTIRS